MSRIRIKEIILLVLGSAIIIVLADYASFSLKSTNNLIYSFIDPIFEFFASIVSAISDFLSNLLVGSFF